MFSLDGDELPHRPVLRGTLEAGDEPHVERLRKLQNDLGLLLLVDLTGDRLEAIPLKLEFAHTRLATGEDAAWIERRFVDACAALGTEAAAHDGRLVSRWR